MTLEGLVYGLVDDSRLIGDKRVAATCRDLTVSWSRFSFHSSILEDDKVEAILERALACGCRYCFIQWYGNLISPNELPLGCESWDFAATLERWLAATEFLVAGFLIGDEHTWFGFARRCLVVDLACYRALGKPRFERSAAEPTALPEPAIETAGSTIRSLAPTSQHCVVVPRQPGWPLIRAALENGLPVPDLGPQVRGHTLSLEPDQPPRRRALARYLGAGVEDYDPAARDIDLSPEQARFLRSVRAQTANARKAVGLWNIEPYTDIEPPTGFDGPLSALYTVAQGFKPNMFLERLGFDDRTRVVFFDYSSQALAVRKCIVEQWDGDDFPHFIRYLFRVFPDPDTHYYLWRGLRPDEIDWQDMARLWERELAAWGGAAALGDHWRAYRQLPHEYIHCNLLTDTSALRDAIAPQGAAAVWWSNAFFTIYSNWYLSLDERRRCYESWIAALAERHPDLCLFGSDYVNNSVNDARAGCYWQQFRALDRSGLEPVKLHRRQISM